MEQRAGVAGELFPVAWPIATALAEPRAAEGPVRPRLSTTIAASMNIRIRILLLGPTPRSGPCSPPIQALPIGHGQTTDSPAGTVRRAGDRAARSARGALPRVRPLDHHEPRVAR